MFGLNFYFSSQLKQSHTDGLYEGSKIKEIWKWQIIEPICFYKSYFLRVDKSTLNMFTFSQVTGVLFNKLLFSGTKGHLYSFEKVNVAAENVQVFPRE